VVFKTIYGASEGLAIVVFAALAIRYWRTERRQWAVVTVGAVLTVAGMLVQVILPYSLHRHSARVESLSATIALILIGQVGIQMGLAQNRRRLRREHEARPAEAGGSADEFGAD
jgi:hypothetical protein